MKYFIPLSLFCLINQAAAQDSTSVQKFSSSLTERFAETRMFDFEYVNKSSHRIQPVLRGDKQGKINVNNNRGFRTSFNIPVLKGNKWQLTYSLFYRYEGMELIDAQGEMKEVDLNYISSTGSYTYFTSFLGKLLVLNGSLIIDGSQKNFERLKPMASAMLVLKKTKEASMSVGAIGIMDPNAKIPVFPIVSYSRNLENNWRLDIIFPQRVLLQTNFLANGRFSVGTQLNGSNFYHRTAKLVDFANKFEFRQTELRTGVSYEYLLNKSIVLTTKAGIINQISAKFGERGKSFNDDDYLMKIKSGASSYVNLGISFNPF